MDGLVTEQFLMEKEALMGPAGWAAKKVGVGIAKKVGKSAMGGVRDVQAIHKGMKRSGFAGSPRHPLRTLKGLGRVGVGALTGGKVGAGAAAARHIREHIPAEDKAKMRKGTRRALKYGPGLAETGAAVHGVGRLAKGGLSAAKGLVSGGGKKALPGAAASAARGVVGSAPHRKLPGPSLSEHRAMALGKKLPPREAIKTSWKPQSALGKTAMLMKEAGVISAAKDLGGLGVGALALAHERAERKAKGETRAYGPEGATHSMTAPQVARHSPYRHTPAYSAAHHTSQHLARQGDHGADQQKHVHAPHPKGGAVADSGSKTKPLKLKSGRFHRPGRYPN
jgi:hypothetical protein